MAVLIPIAISTAISLGASLLISALQPKPPGIERNKQDTRIQSSEYGTPITRGYGTFRTAGTLIWEAGTGLVDHVTTQHTGGGKRRGPDVTTHSYTVSCALLVCAGPVQGITRIWADTDLIYNSATLGAVTTTLTNNGNPGLSIYIGDELQMPNSWIVADKGVGNVSAHRGYCYVVFKDLNLDRFGDRIPTFTFEVVQGTVAVADVVTAECALVGLTSASLNLTQCTDPVRGMVINKQQAPRVALEELARDFWCDFVDVDGQIKGVKRPQTTYGLINALDLAAYEEGGEAPEQLDATRGLALDIPRTVEVTYFDYNRLYENGKQTFSRQVPGSQQVLAVDTPLVMTAPEADKLAKILCMTNWTERTRVKWQLPPKYISYAPGDVMTLPTPAGGQIEVRITKMNFSVGGMIQFEGVSQFDDAYNQVGLGDVGQNAWAVSGLGPNPTIPVQPCNTTLWVGDTPVLRDSDVPLIRPNGGLGSNFYYVGGYRSGCTANGFWDGAAVYRDTDGSSNYQIVASLQQEATIGTLVNALPSATGLDTTDTLTVQLSSGQLNQISNTAFNNTQSINAAVIGNGSSAEVIQFRDVVNIGNNQYQLTTIRRGLRGTTAQSHAAGQTFVLIDSSLQLVPIAANENGTTFNHIAVTTGQTIGGQTVTPVTNQGHSLESGASVPSVPTNVVVNNSGGVAVLLWNTPAQNATTLDYYVVSVFTDSGHTTPVSGYNAVAVYGNHLTVPQPPSGGTYYYTVAAHNAFGVGAAASGSYTPTSAPQLQTPAWSAPTLLNSWANYGGSNTPAGYYTNIGFVYLRGVIKSGTIGQAAFNLPAGYRPAYQIYLTAHCYNGTNVVLARVTVNTNGDVVPDVGSNNYLSLDGLAFSLQS